MKDLPANSTTGEATQPEPPTGSPALAKNAQSGVTLLVVEDDEGVRELEVQILVKSGFRVLQAGSVAEALRAAGTPGPLQLLLTDFSLPDGNGLDLARRFRQLHPQLPIILVSGSVAGLDGKPEGLEHLAVMEKPFQIPELLSLVRTLLNDTSTPGSR